MIVSVGSAWLFFKETEIRTPNVWPPYIKRYSNVFTGNIRVVDSETNSTLFSYYDDSSVYPASIEKKSSNEWVVIFKHRNQ